MRGRTNLSGGGIFLNAEIAECEVAKNENIVAGDFVTYESVIKNALKIDATANFIYPLSDGRYIVFGNYAEVIEISDGIIKSPLAHFVITECQQWFPLGNDCFVGVAIGVSASYALVKIHFVSFDVENNTLQKKASGSTSFPCNDQYSFTANCFFENNVIVAFCSGYYNSKHSLYKCDFELGGTDFDSYTATGSRTDLGNIDTYCSSVLKLSQDNYSFVTTYSTMKVGLVSNNTLVEVRSLPLSLKNLDYKGNMQVKGENNEFSILFRVNIYSLYAIDLTWNAEEKTRFDISVSEPYLLTSLPRYTEVYTPLMLVPQKYMYSVNVDSAEDRIAIIDYTQNEKRVTMHPFVSVSAQPSKLGLHNEGDFLIIGAYNKVFLSKIKNNMIEDLTEEKTYVKNANNVFYINGVAKQSGASGDTIEVYIPTV